MLTIVYRAGIVDNTRCTIATCYCKMKEQYQLNSQCVYYSTLLVYTVLFVLDNCSNYW